LNLRNRNRFSQLFKDLVIGPKTEEERMALEEFVGETDDNQEQTTNVELETIPILTTDKLAEAVQEEEHSDLLGEEIIQTPQQILSQAEYVESVCQDIELMQFFVNKFVYKLWKCVFREQDQQDEGKTINMIRLKGLTGKKFHDTATRAFLSEYDGTESLEIPKGYTFPKPPRYMQKYAAYRIKKDPYFCNLSGTGAGKTLSAVLAGRVIDSRLTIKPPCNGH
jgi:hypothetical protein